MLPDVFIYVPEANQIVRIAEGTGDNLTPDDLDSGFRDYIYYEQYSVEQGMPEIDGGQLMLSNFVDNTYNTLIEAIPSILYLAYGNDITIYTILKH